MGVNKALFMNFSVKGMFNFAMTSVKYESDIQSITSVLPRVKIQDNDGMEEIGLLTPPLNPLLPTSFHFNPSMDK